MAAENSIFCTSKAPFAMHLQHILQQLENVYNGEPWYGESVLAKLRAISAETAFARPAGLHSVAELVGHMIAWRTAAIEWLHGHTGFRIELNSTTDWPPYEALQSVGWAELQRQLAETQRQLVSLLQTKTDAILTQTAEPKSYTFQFLLEGIVQHDIYHLGQIGLVAKIVSLPAEREL